MVGLVVTLFVLRAHSLEPQYSIFSPFNRTDVSEIGNWSLRGSAVSWKNVIRLTSDSLKSEWGALCHRAPTSFVDWSIDIELASRGKGDAGGSISFLFSDAVCPQQPANFSGFQVTIKNSEIDQSGDSPIYFSEGTFVGAKEYARIKLRNQKDPIRVKIIRSEGKVIVEYTTFMRFDTLFSVDLTTKIPDFGYFTIAAATDIDHSDNADVYTIKTRAQTEITTDHISEKILSNNRKILESDALKRREAKRTRREALLPRMHRYLELMSASNNALGISGGEPDMRDSFDLVMESANRAMESVTIDMLKVFINRYLQDTLAKAGQKVNLAMNSFDDTKSDLSEMWSYLRSQLVELASDSREALTRIGEEAMSAAKAVNLDRQLDRHAVRLVQRTSTRTHSEADWVNRTLVAIMAVELLAYLLFFARQHAKTHGFKKFD